MQSRRSPPLARSDDPTAALWLPLRKLFGAPGILVQRFGLDEERSRVLWLTRLRWVAIVGQLAVCAPALAGGWLEPRAVPWYLGTVLALGAYNLFSVWRLRAPGQPVGGALPQLGVDLVALTVLLVLSGGAWNPFAPIFYIHAGLGALLLTGWRSLVLAGLLIGVAVVISVAPSMPPAMPAPTTPVGVQLPSQILIALVIWAMTGWLARLLASQRRLLQNLRDHQGRVDHLRAAGALAAGFSHEFSTPLNTLKLRLDRIGRRDLGEVTERDVEVALAAAERCESVLRSMVGRQLDPNEIRLEPTDVAGLCERVVSSWSSTSGRAKLDLVVEAGPAHHCMLPAVPFTQALLDLLDNAAEATAGRVLLRVSCRPQLCLVSVEDEGPGWPDVVRANLGQPFLTLKPQGTGLGLYNAHSLAMALGGELRLEDREGGGAVAVFALPCDDDSLSERA